MKTDNVCRELPCDDHGSERPRFFPGQLITADDLTLGYEYVRNKMRRHNRLLHGWGVVCGARVSSVKNLENKCEPWKVKIEPGYILGPYGDEILIDCPQTVDLRAKGLSAVTGEPCIDVPDPWCSDVIEKHDDRPVYVAVKYKEVPSRPVRVQPLGCGCDDTQCEYSRWRDGYEIGILSTCPQSHIDPPSWEDIVKGELPGCPPCPAEPWVVLAKVSMGADGKVEIDNCFCRRLVISFGRFAWQCSEGNASPSNGTTINGDNTTGAIQKDYRETD
jgi:hypothetical protein